MHIGAYDLNPLDHTLRGPAGTVQLSPLASQFLQILARQPGTVVERQALIDELWRGDYLVGEPALNRVVSETRRAVGDSPRQPALIQTVHRRGYRLVAAENASAPLALAPVGEERWARIWRYCLATFVVVVAGLVALLIAAVYARMNR